MKHGWIKVAACIPKVVVADPKENRKVIETKMKEAYASGARIIVFPELSISSYTCGDLFFQSRLQQESLYQLKELAKSTSDMSAVVYVGLPIAVDGNLYNVAAILYRGNVLGLIPKTFIPNYKEFYEMRYFTPGNAECVNVTLWEDVTVPMGTNLLIEVEEIPGLKIGAEICEDLWTPNPPSIRHALAGATVLVNLSASDEVTGKAMYRKDLVTGQSARLVCGYIYVSAGEGESTQDVVYSGHSMIAENGILLSEAKPFCNQDVISELDVEKLLAERRKANTFQNRLQGDSQSDYRCIKVSLDMEETVLTRYIDPAPFVPGDTFKRDARCEEILFIQSMGLKKRLEHTGCKSAVIGISGGLDSTLALLVTVKAFDMLSIPRENIVAVTMPGFGTTDRTYQNALDLIHQLGAKLVEVDIKDAVRIHFRDIGQDENVHDITYENGQARERTQILMDIANKSNGMVIGTGDMSELALGWATYNGDHMSMYGVNASVPKTLVRHLVRYYADTCQEQKLSEVLYDVLDTPVSPELLPPTEGQISQKTEDIVGPYELHDFFLYYMMRFGFAPDKIYRLAQIAFRGQYDTEEIHQWLRKFYWRFFSQQFKRSCLPDGPKVGSVAVSPRGDLRMPSDASVRIWMDMIEQMK